MKNVRELETYGAILIGCGIMAYTLMLASVDAPVWATIEFVMGTLFMVVGDVGDSALVEPDGDELVSQLGKRRWRVMGDPEDGWWVEVDSDGSELPGDWEYDRKGGYVYCSFS